MKQSLVIFAAALAFGAISEEAFAGVAGSLRIEANQAVKTVTFPAADLVNPSMATKVYSRLEKVAAEVCQVDGDAPAWVLKEDRDCVERALIGALQDLNSPTLRETHVRAKESEVVSARR